MGQTRREPILGLEWERRNFRIQKTGYLGAKDTLRKKMRARMSEGVEETTQDVINAWRKKQVRRQAVTAARNWALTVMFPVLRRGLGFRMSVEVRERWDELQSCSDLTDFLRKSQGLGSQTQRIATRACACCGHTIWRVERYDSYDAPSTVCEVCAESGAVQSTTTHRWYGNAAAMEAAEEIKLLWIVDNEQLARQQVIFSDFMNNKVTTLDGAEITIDGEPVYHKNNMMLRYHSGVAAPQYDDHPIRVGTELEVNRAGSNRGDKQDSTIARILMATKHAVKVERDGSVTGFEIITGHGSPASLRNVLTPIFTGDCLEGYSTSTRTGAHVHVTNPFTDRTGSFEDCRSLGKAFAPMRPLYEKIAGRAYTQHAREGVSANRYSALAWRAELGTLELRLFKMQMSLPKLMRNLGFAWAVTHYMSQAGLNPVTEQANTSLAEFIEFVGDLPREQTIELRAALAFHGYKVPNDEKAYRKMYRDLGLRTAIA